MSQPGTRRLVALGALLLCGLGGIVPLLLVEPDLPCDSDEGYHVVPSLVFYQDAMDGDAAAFLRHTAKAGRYPFLHGWIVAGSMAVAGPSYLVARLTSAAFLALSCGMAFLLLSRLRPGTHLLWGVVLAAGIALAPENLTMGVLCMLETPGLFLTLLAVWLYHRFLDRPESRWSGLLVGVTLTALLFVKFPYAAYVFAPIAVSELIRARWNPLRMLRAGSPLVWAPVLGALAFWLIVPQTRQGIVTFLAVSSGPSSQAGRDPGEIPHIQPDLVAFYMRTIVERLAPGAVWGWAALGGAVIFTLSRLRFVGVVMMGAVLWTLFTLTLSFRTYGVDRFLVPLGGLIAVAGIGGWADLAGWVSRKDGAFRTAGYGVVALLLLAVGTDAAFRAPKLRDEALRAVETTPESARTMERILDELPRPANVLLVGSWDQMSESGLRAHFLMGDRSAHYTDLDVTSIRLWRIYDDTEKLDAWLETASRSNPDPGVGRARALVVIRPGEELAEGIPDREVWRRFETRVAEVTAGRPPVEEWTDTFGRVEIHRLDPIRPTGGD